MNISNIKSQNKIVDLFVDLVEIPSPSLQEKDLANYIKDVFSIYGIKSQLDSYGNLIAKIQPTSDCKHIEPLLLSAHMDVVGNTDPINIKLSSCGKYIETDKTRTLGADNKAGIAVIMDLAIGINSLDSNISHGPVEIVFTRDEEHGMTGVKNLDTTNINSKYALICDGEHLGELDVEGAGFTNVLVHIHHGKGGHSAMNIYDESRVNAIKVLSEFDSQIPNGVYKQNERGIITSINAASNIGGSASFYISELVKNKVEYNRSYSEQKIIENVVDGSMKNLIASESAVVYSIRSSDPENENELLALIKSTADNLNKKYQGNIRIDVTIKRHLNQFVRSDDETLSNIIVEVAKEVGIDTEPASFHAGAETHIFANEKVNINKEKFLPVILGVANLYNVHSRDEKIEWASLIKGRELLEKIVITFAKNNK